MKLPMKWIWLPEGKYPKSQKTKYSGFQDNIDGNYTVAEFKKTYTFEKTVSKIELIFSGDTEVQLYCNDKIVATGPAYSGGDFRCNDFPRSDFYAMCTEILPNTDCVSLFARVKMMPVRICEYSKGRGGFMLFGYVTFEDGSRTVITTDSSWEARKNSAYKEPYLYDTGIAKDEYTYAQEIEDVWNARIAPISTRKEEIVAAGGNHIKLEPHEEKEVVLEFDKIYAGFLNICVKTNGNLYAKVVCRELEETGSSEEFTFTEDNEYRGFTLHSAGNLLINLKNDSDAESEFELNFISTFYPVDNVAITTTNDEELNTVLDVCRHTLKICRQLHHLDSPRHCEPLACTGDYYIETLMTLFSFGDMSLAEFDIKRTATLLRDNDGRMFHTTYSLIWVKMLYDVYMFTGNKGLLYDCLDALQLLLKRFEKYIGKNGLIENPPDYMFVDWIYIDEISMHHPPKALGQTCLNMFYYGALDTAVRIFDELSETQWARECTEKKNNLKNSINSLLYDAEKGMYFEGLTTKTAEGLISLYMPQNVDRRYYMKHSNILSVYFGVCDGNKKEEIIEKIMSDECPGDIQPYFTHYLLEAVYRSGLRERYTLKILDRWKKHVAECKKGLVEGFVKPEPTYSFDHSHAWGGTPLYSLPKALLGLEINKPGLSEITLDLSLLGLKNATAELATPHGILTCILEDGKEPVLIYPPDITVNIK